MKYLIAFAILFIYISSIASLFFIIKDLIKLNKPKRKPMNQDSKIHEVYEDYVKSMRTPEILKLNYSQFINKLLTDDQFNETWGKYITEEIHIFNRIDLYGRKGYSLKDLNYDDDAALLKTLEEADIPKRKLK